MTPRGDSPSLISLVDRLLRFVYSLGGDRVLRTLGFESSAKQAYSWLLLSVVDDIQTVTIDDVSASFRISSPFEFDLFYNEEYNNEIPVIRDVLSRLEPNDVFYDVGAHVGIYAILVANALDEGRSIAFEPNPENERHLRENAELNDGCIECYKYALSKASGHAELSVRGTEAEATGALRKANDALDRTISIETVAGDELISKGEAPPPDVLKIDVEGAELDVIQGLQSALGRDSCRLVYCECHPDELEDRGQSTEDVVQILESLGFTTERIHQRDKQPFILARKRHT